MFGTMNSAELTPVDIAKKLREIELANPQWEKFKAELTPIPVATLPVVSFHFLNPKSLIQ